MPSSPPRCLIGVRLAPGRASDRLRKKDGRMTTDFKLLAALALHRFGSRLDCGHRRRSARRNAGRSGTAHLVCLAARRRRALFLNTAPNNWRKESWAQRKQAGGSMGNSPASDRVMKANANAQISAEPPDRDQQNQGANVGH